MYMHQTLHKQVAVTCSMLSWVTAILVYHCNKQASNVFLSIQFGTHVSQLVRHVLPWSYEPLTSLGELSLSCLNRLSVCLSCLFWLWIPPVVYSCTVPPLPPTGPDFIQKKKSFFTVGMHCTSTDFVRYCASAEKNFFFIFFLKWTPAIKYKKNSSCQSWRQPDVSCHTCHVQHMNKILVGLS